MFVAVPSMKFHKSPSSARRRDTCRRADANRRFFLFNRTRL